jgi:hypothetical protein
MLAGDSRAIERAISTTDLTAFGTQCAVLSLLDGVDGCSLSTSPDARGPSAYSDGYDFGPYTMHHADQHFLGSLLVDSLELVYTPDSNSRGL